MMLSGVCTFTGAVHAADIELSQSTSAQQQTSTSIALSQNGLTASGSNESNVSNDTQVTADDSQNTDSTANNTQTPAQESSEAAEPANTLVASASSSLNSIKCIGRVFKYHKHYHSQYSA